MIYIKEIYVDDSSVILRAEGILDCESIPPLKNICERYLEWERKVMLQVEGLLYITREGRDFLREIQNKGVILEGFESVWSESLRMDGSD